MWPRFSRTVHHSRKTLALKQCCPKHLGSANNFSCSVLQFSFWVFFFPFAEGPCFSIEEKLLFAGKCTRLGCLLCSPLCCIWAVIAYILFLFRLSIIHIFLVYSVMTLLGSSVLLGCICQHNDGCWHFVRVFHTDFCLWLPKKVIFYFSKATK